MNMPMGMILLLIVGAAVYFGIAQRLLDRMRLTDRQAIVFIFAMIVGTFVNIPLLNGPVQATVNVGGALLPALLCIWLIAKADQAKERIRAILSAVAVVVFIYLGSRYLPHEPETMFMDPKLLYGIGAGLIAYLAGRSRRSAFIGAALGVMMSDLLRLALLFNRGVAGTTSLGGAGVFDVTIVAALVAVMTAELVGETREKLQGGHKSHGDLAGLYEFSEELSADKSEQKSSVISLDRKRKNSSMKGGEKENE